MTAANLIRDFGNVPGRDQFLQQANAPVEPGDETLVNATAQQAIQGRPIAPLPYNIAGTFAGVMKPGSLDRTVFPTAQIQDRREILRTSIFSPENNPLMRLRVDPGAQVGDYVSLLMHNYTGRGQTFNNEGNATRMWELAAGANFLHYTFFPVVIDTRTERTVFPYICIYSGYPLGASVTYGRVPRYVPQTMLPDANGNNIRVNIAQAFLGDLNAKLSVIASANMSGAVPDSFITIMPWVPEQAYTQRVTDFGERAWQVSGASMGLAVAASTCGLPSIAYTGYFKSLGSLPELTASGATSRAVRDMRVSEVAKSRNTVDNVRFLPIKAYWAQGNEFPLVIPYQNNLGGNYESMLERYQSQYLSSTNIVLISQVRAFFAASDVADGVDFRTRKTYLFLADNLTNTAMMAAYGQMYLNGSFTGGGDVIMREMEVAEQRAGRKLALSKASAEITKALKGKPVVKAQRAIARRTAQATKTKAKTEAKKAEKDRKFTNRIVAQYGPAKRQYAAARKAATKAGQLPRRRALLAPGLNMDPAMLAEKEQRMPALTSAERKALAANLRRARAQRADEMDPDTTAGRPGGTGMDDDDDTMAAVSRPVPVLRARRPGRVQTEEGVRMLGAKDWQIDRPAMAEETITTAAQRRAVGREAALAARRGPVDPADVAEFQSTLNINQPTSDESPDMFGP